MTKEKLEKLNKLQEEVKGCEATLMRIEDFQVSGGPVGLTLGLMGSRLRVPAEMQDEVVSMVKTSYTRKLAGLKDKFKNMEVDKTNE